MLSNKTDSALSRGALWPKIAIPLRICTQVCKTCCMYTNKVEWNPGARTSRDTVPVISSQNRTWTKWNETLVPVHLVLSSFHKTATFCDGDVSWKNNFLRGNFVIGSFVKVYASKANVLCWDDVLCEERCEGPFSKIISSVCIFFVFCFLL